MNSTVPFRIVPLPGEIAALARAERVDSFGNESPIVRDGQPHQCRRCLQLTTPDEAVLLIAHKPFRSQQPYAESGPVFIHERVCEPYNETAGYPVEFPRHQVVLRAYNERDQIVGAEVVGERRAEDVITRLFENRDVAYLHARNLAYGCYMFRINRA